MSGYTGLAARVLRLLRGAASSRERMNRAFGGLFIAAGAFRQPFRRAVRALGTADDFLRRAVRRARGAASCERNNRWQIRAALILHMLYRSLDTKRMTDDSPESESIMRSEDAGDLPSDFHVGICRKR